MDHNKETRRIPRHWRLTLLLPLLIGFVPQLGAQEPAVTPASADSCVSCHSQLTGSPGEAVTRMETDVHADHGFSCASCHGGDPTQTDRALAEDARMGFIGQPAPAAVQSLCGKCHSDADFMRTYDPSIRVDQVTEYVTSVHGMRVAEGDTRVATCISCHDSHGILPVSDPNAPVYPTHVATTCGNCHANAEYMADYSIGTDQLEKYLASVHADALIEKQDLSAPTCNDCHGNHGATPPGVESVANVCGTCHARQSELFASSRHGEIFPALGLADCLVCHSNHEVRQPTDAMLDVEGDAPCVMCHLEGDAGYTAAQTMRARIDQLAEGIADAGAVLDRAERAGMEVSRARFDLSDAHDSLLNARVLVHAFSPEALDEVVDPGLEVSNRSYQEGLDALEQLRFRRNGLAVSLAIIVLTVLALYLKIRQLEGREHSHGNDSA